MDERAQARLGELLQRQSFAVVDGGLATQLERLGADLNNSLWSARLLLDSGGAAMIKAVHRAYLDAGADVLITSSYQASIEGFRQRGLGEDDEARAEFWADEDRRRGREWPLVAASIGPYGATLHDGSEYRGDYGARMSQEEFIDFHLPRIRLLLADPALAPDLFACETVPCLKEGRALVKLFETHFPDQRLWLSFTCRDQEHLSDGHKFSEAVVELQQSEVVAAVGVNCTSPQFIGGLLESVRGSVRKPLVVYPNSGEGWDAAAQQWTPADASDDITRIRAALRQLSQPATPQ
ncbi:homocysteine smethyltransferase 1, putative [Acanthamoeba castellanii str. Neff]|uniref:Homocysteine smethyltransferase 1, putative n=1 Tax=Acanthamoeba castellanii (strain ATCC 30010 / Neff) TaxID=1257118 RepID=L8GXS8_ACACF|nr:homocysteine smethyltransferase 1, putative [Acanthamoeba castellanii str. Neff]ELR17368.1 homocysteine smethyltransferase 1, putative [Acanthamoeba castellanii str. Neff]